MGNYIQSEQQYELAEDFYIKTNSQDHQAYLVLKSQRARLYKEMGKYEQAEQLFLEVLEIWKKNLGVEHPFYASALGNLADLNMSRGRFDLAEPLFQKALVIFKAAGEQSPEYAASLVNLGNLYRLMGDSSRAEQLFLKALSVGKATRRDQHPSYANNLDVLALVYKSVQDFGKAETLYEQALAIRKEAVGEHHILYATSLHNLAALYYDRKEDLKAASFYEQALQIQKEAVGDRHPDYATTMHNLATLSASSGDYKRAESLYLSSLAIKEKVLGKDHFKYAESQHSLAVLYQNLGDFAEADQLYQPALSASRRVLDSAALVQSERQQLAMIQILRYQLDSYISLGVETKQYSSNIFNHVLSWKGSTLMRQRAMRQTMRDPNMAKVYQKLHQVVRQAFSLSRSVPADSELLENWKNQIQELNLQREKLEGDLSKQSAEFRAATEEVILPTFLPIMPRNSVFIDFLEIDLSYPFKEMKGERRWKRELIAFVLRPNAAEENQVQLLALGSMAPLSDAINTWRKTYGQTQDEKSAGKILREKIWEPLLPYLGEAETILISTDGALGNLPFAALPGRNPDTYLIEDHRIALIPVPRMLPELMKNRPEDSGATGDLLLIGDVDYTANLKQIAPSDGSRAPVGKTWFPELAGTKKEIAALQNLYLETFGDIADRIKSLTRDQGSEATEAHFREFAPQFKHLHIATHGFFAGADIPSALNGNTPHTHRIIGDRELPVVGYDPNVLSGLALTGANRKLEADGDDGVLLSQEIAFLPMQSVDTVVLSACDTGLGKVAGGEGLLGIQRAFQVAGARSTVASYWKVDDEVTVFLMKRFYRNLWKDKMSRLDALREAQLYVLNHPNEIGKFGKRASPKFWAAFSLSGDWR